MVVLVRVGRYLVGFEVELGLVPRLDSLPELELVTALESPPWPPPLALRRPAGWVRVQIRGTPHLPAVEALGLRERFGFALKRAQFEPFREQKQVPPVVVGFRQSVAQQLGYRLPPDQGLW